jgi:hypothetical protein
MGTDYACVQVAASQVLALECRWSGRRNDRSHECSRQGYRTTGPINCGNPNEFPFRDLAERVVVMTGLAHRSSIVLCRRTSQDSVVPTLVKHTAAKLATDCSQRVYGELIPISRNCLREGEFERADQSCVSDPHRSRNCANCRQAVMPLQGSCSSIFDLIRIGRKRSLISATELLACPIAATC